MDQFLLDLLAENPLGIWDVAAAIVLACVVVYVLLLFRQEMGKDRGADSGSSLEEKVRGAAEKLTDDIVSEIWLEPKWWAGMSVPENFEEILRIIVRPRVRRVVWKFMGLELPQVRMRRSPGVVGRSIDPQCNRDDESKGRKCDEN